MTVIFSNSRNAPSRPKEGAIEASVERPGNASTSQGEEETPETALPRGIVGVDSPRASDPASDKDRCEIFPS
jgi:hypothetical protein